MRHIGLVAAFCLLGSLLGCGGVSSTAIEPTPGVVKSYQLNETQTTNTGAPMLSAVRAYTVPTFSPVKEIDAPSIEKRSSQLDRLQPDQKWVAARKTPEGYFLTPPHDLGPTYLHIKADGRIGEGWYSKTAKLSLNREDWPDGKLFEQVEGTPREGSFRFELIYTGRQGPNLQLAYREYVDDMQRTAYSQKLSYNLKQSRTITFRSLRIHVEEATNSQIRFRVLDDGDLSWLPNK